MSRSNGKVSNFSLAKMKTYFQRDLKHDLISGLVVALIAIPLAIAFAVASGARPEQGLYTAIIAGIVMGALSGSNYQVSGPTGAFIVILLGVVNKFGIDGLMTAGFMAGIILLLMGIFKFGSVIKYIPYPVTVGFTAGIGTIIFSGQIKDFLGLKFPHRAENFLETVQFIASAITQNINVSAVIIGGVTLITYIIWKKKIKGFPPAPFAFLVGTITSVIITTFFKDVLPMPALVGEIAQGLPQISVPNLSWERMQMLIPSAFTIAMLGAIESLLSAVVADGMTGTKHKSNKELISQGVGNIILPFFGGIPATGAIARTAANIKNGARTRGSTMIHGFTLLFILLVAAPLAKYIPLAALAAILMMVAYGMAEIPHFIHLLKSPRQDALVLLVTYLLTVFVDLTVAVGIGIVLAAVLFIYKVSKLSAEKILENPDHTDGSKRLHASIADCPEITMYELAGPLFFGVASELENRIQFSAGKVLILRMKHVYHIDASAVHVLEIIIDGALRNGGKVYLSTLHSEVKEALKKHGLIKKLGGEHYIPNNTTEAIERAKKDLGKK